MYEEYASLTRRMRGANNDVEIARQTYGKLNDERDKLLSKHTWAIGVHVILGGYVVVVGTDIGLQIELFE